MRRILIIALDCLDTEVLFKEERLENLRRLMDYGCYGYLDSDEYFKDALSATRPIYRQVDRQGKRVILSGTVPADLLEEPGIAIHRFDLSQSLTLIAKDDWDCFIFNNDPRELNLPAEYENDGDNYIQLDGQIGNILSSLDERSDLLILAVQGNTNDHKGFFILASTVNPLSGELKGVRPIDLIPTLLELGEYEIPAEIPGKSLITGLSIASSSDNDLTEEEEVLLRERLSGLGYIS
jgi:hypothetical protein